jgi:hypothetical protein
VKTGETAKIKSLHQVRHLGHDFYAKSSLECHVRNLDP